MTFRPGESGNPNGRPKNPQGRTVLRKALDKVAKEKYNGKPFLDYVAEKAYADKEWGLAVLHKLVPTLKALSADIKTEAFKIIIERPDDREADKTQEVSG